MGISIPIACKHPIFCGIFGGKQQFRELTIVYHGLPEGVAIHMFRDDNFIHLLDSKPHLLGVKNGVVDLRTGELRARLPEDMIFTVIDVTFDPEASDALIRSTVLSAMADDVEMATYIQKLLGYGCTGEVCEEIFPVFTGSGRNCKGVLVKAVHRR